MQNYQDTEDAFREGLINGQTDEELNAHLLNLSNQPIDNERVRHRDVIRGLTVNHLILQRHMDKLDKQNSRLQSAVIVLTVVSTVASVAQVWAAFKQACP